LICSFFDSGFSSAKNFINIIGPAEPSTSMNDNAAGDLEGCGTRIDGSTFFGANVNKIDEPGEPNIESNSGEGESKICREQDRASILASVSSSNPETLTQKVGWILNNYPETRNSDIALQLQYWATFCPDMYDGVAIAPNDLYRLPRLTSLGRARARIQNTLRLFTADAEVRRRRGTLSNEEKEEASEARFKSAPVYAVYVDESGKTQQIILVGSLWILQGPETLRIVRKLMDWREASGFNRELHFADVNDKDLDYYKQAIDIVIDNATALSFKYITVQRAGAGRPQDVVPKLLYYLLVKGVSHERDSGRAPLPRNLQVWKDTEEEGYDRLVLAEVRDKLLTAATAQFNRQLRIDVLEASDSKGNDLIQIADLFTGSLNRFLNPPDPPPKNSHPKDELAQHVLKRTNVSLEAEQNDHYGDLSVRINL
jgi:hypothetical protein